MSHLWHSSSSIYRSTGWFHMCNIWYICDWKWLFLITSDWRTQYVWIQYILLLPWHLLASLLPPFICLTKLHCDASQNDPTSFVRPLHRLLCCVLLFYMNTANKDKGKLLLCSWRWHVHGGTALHQFLIVASDVGECSDILCYNNFSIRQKNSWYNWMWGWVGPWTSLNVS